MTIMPPGMFLVYKKTKTFETTYCLYHKYDSFESKLIIFEYFYIRKCNLWPLLSIDTSLVQNNPEPEKQCMIVWLGVENWCCLTKTSFEKKRKTLKKTPQIMVFALIAVALLWMKGGRSNCRMIRRCRPEKYQSLWNSAQKRRSYDNFYSRYVFGL